MPPRAASTFPLAVVEPACTKKKQSLKIVAREVWLFTELCVPLTAATGVLTVRVSWHRLKLTVSSNEAKGRKGKVGTKEQNNHSKVTERVNYRTGAAVSSALHSALRPAADSGLRR